MKERSDDPRVSRTLEAIDRTFREMVLEDGIDSVTVRELCRRACVNKNTFYRYYGAIEDLVAEVMAGYVAQWQQRSFASVGTHSGAAATTRELFLFGAVQDELYETITCNPAWGAVQQRLQRDASGSPEEKAPEGFSPAQWRLYYAYVSESGLAMYRAWVTSGKTMPVQEAADLAAETVAAGAKAMLRSMGVRA